MLNFRRGNGYQKFKVKRSGRDIEAEDIFLDAAIQKKHRTKSPGYGRIETALSQKTLTLVFGFFVLAIFLFGGLSFYYETFGYKVYAERSEKNRYISSNIEAQRGIIYDKNFKQLVGNEQTFALTCDYSQLPLEADLLEIEINDVSKILGVAPEELKQKMQDNKKKSSNTAVLYENLDINKIIVLETKLDALPGFVVEKETARNYASADSFSLLLGFVSRDSKDGQLGLEKQYNDYLKETPGIFEKTREKNSDTSKEVMIKAPEPGDNLLLNIDMDLQKNIAEFLKADLEQFKAKAGTVVVTDPKTGGILSLVSFPSFDSNIFSKTLSAEDYNAMMSNSNTSFYNRAIAGEYAIGSTMKPMIASAALQEGVITPATIINDNNGGLQLSDGTFKKDWATHGAVDLNKAIAESCDTYFYIVGGGYQGFKGLGIDKIDKYLDSFGLGKETGIDIAGETTGFIPTSNWKEERYGTSWYPGDTYNISIGQGYMRATPLQLAMATAAIANGGTLYQPQIVNSILDKNNGIVKKFEPIAINQVSVGAEYLADVRAAMRQTVTSDKGTARALQWMPVTSAAKTGTAQTSKADTYHNLITLFAPYDNPQVVITIVIEGVPHETGVANLLARQIMSYYFAKDKDKPADNNGQASEPADNNAIPPVTLPDGEGVHN
ncbi:MAG: penicillin-binding protein 2 [Candidatus Paceibacterota bacterium]